MMTRINRGILIMVLMGLLLSVTAVAEVPKELENIVVTLRSRKTGKEIGKIELIPEEMSKEQIDNALEILYSEGEETLSQMMIRDAFGTFDSESFVGGSYYTEIEIKTDKAYDLESEKLKNKSEKTNNKTRSELHTASNSVNKYVTFENGLSMSFHVIVTMSFYQSGATIYQIYSNNLSASGFPYNGGIENRHYVREIGNNGEYATVSYSYWAYIKLNSPAYYTKVTAHCSDSVTAWAQDY